jgi:hypothetical protein
MQMAIPGYGAEASFYQSNLAYRAGPVSKAVSAYQMVSPCRRQLPMHFAELHLVISAAAPAKLLSLSRHSGHLLATPMFLQMLGGNPVLL